VPEGRSVTWGKGAGWAEAKERVSMLGGCNGGLIIKMTRESECTHLPSERVCEVIVREGEAVVRRAQGLAEDVFLRPPVSRVRRGEAW
jgi:hypothetical protein